MANKLTAPVYISTNDKHVICLKVFVELFGKFWSGQEVNVLGYTPIDLADFVTFHSMGKQGTVKDWSANRTTRNNRPKKTNRKRRRVLHLRNRRHSLL